MTTTNTDADREEAMAWFAESLRAHDADREEAMAWFAETLRDVPATPARELDRADLPELPRLTVRQMRAIRADHVPALVWTIRDGQPSGWAGQCSCGDFAPLVRVDRAEADELHENHVRAHFYDARVSLLVQRLDAARSCR